MDDSFRVDLGMEKGRQFLLDLAGHGLRGADGRPNYDTVSLQMAEQALGKAKLPANIVVDCPHANSYKKPGWDTTETMIRDAATLLRDVLPERRR